MKSGLLPSRMVLIVEDEPLLKLLTADIVEEAGFTTVSAENADEAIAIMASRQDIAMVLTDVNMPGSMDGLKLAHLVCARWPHIKVAVMSGRSSVSNADIPPGCRFLSKPCRTEEIISAIHALIRPGHEDSYRVYLDV